jgi:DNA-binding NarL/FixJ family response regulator
MSLSVPKISIGLVEDQFLFRKGMKSILGKWPNLDVIFESADGFSVMEKLKAEKKLPDVMLVDLSLPPQGQREFSGVAVVEVLREEFPSIRIIILSVHSDENFIIQLIERGAHAYLVKDSDPQEVYEAILAVHTKGSYINEKVLVAIQNNLGKKNKARTLSPAVQLTRREEEILRLICQQKTTEEIAEKLFISIKTVNGHRNNLLHKTSSRNMAGLVMYAIKNGIVTLL